MNFPVHKIEENLAVGERKQLAFSSDLHLIADNCNENAIHRWLLRQVERNADIYIIGDVADWIFKNDKRYQASSLSEKIAARDDQFNEAVNHVVNFLKPYATHIKGLALGNHELTLLKHGSANPLKFVIDFLNTEKDVDIKMLGYRGFIRYRFCHNDSRKQFSTYTIFYNHGNGGSATVTKGMIQVNRMLVKLNADLFVFGHLHTKFTTEDRRVELDSRGNVITKSIRTIQLSTFKNKISQNLSTSWEDLKGFTPSPMGGANVELSCFYTDNKYRLETAVTT